MAGFVDVPPDVAGLLYPNKSEDFVSPVSVLVKELFLAMRFYLLYRVSVALSLPMFL